MRDFYLSGWGVGKKEEYVLVCFPSLGVAWLSPAAGDPSQQGRGVGGAGVPASGRAAGVREAPPVPPLQRPRWRLSQCRRLRKAGDRRPSAGSGGRRRARAPAPSVWEAAPGFSF